MPKEELPAKPTWPAIIQLLPILLLWAICTWLSKYVFLPIIVFDKEPLSIVEPHPISQYSFIITIPIWGYLILRSLFGKNPKPFLPITQPSKILTLSLIIVSLIITLEPIEQLEPISTFCSIIVLWPIEQFFPICLILQQ